MKTRTRQIALGMGLLLAAGCAGQQVTTDYSPAAGFSKFRTFALVSPPDSGAQQLLDQQVRNAVQAQLGAKGLTETDRQSADTGRPDRSAARGAWARTPPAMAIARPPAMAHAVGVTSRPRG